MILEEKALTLEEVSDLVGDSEKGKEVKKFIKKFSNKKLAKSNEMKEELEKLGLIQLKNRDIVSIVNFAPKDAVDLLKVLQGISLKQEEVDKILNVTKQY